MNITKLKLQKLTDKIVSDLPVYLSDPDVIKYNYYNNISGLGVKVMRKNGKMTLESLALIVTNLATEMRAGFAKVDAFIVKQEDFNKKQEEFNQEVRTFMKDQKIFNERIEQDVIDIKQDIKDIKSCPTIARELKLIKQ